MLWQVTVGKHNGHDDDGLLAMRGRRVEDRRSVDGLPRLAGWRDRADVNRRLDCSSCRSSTTRLTIISGPKSEEPGPASGEIVALDAATGKVKWKEELSTPGLWRHHGGQRPRLRHHLRRLAVSAFDAKIGQVVWREKLPAGTNSGVMVEGDTLIAPAGVAAAAGQSPQIVAFRAGE